MPDKDPKTGKLLPGHRLTVGRKNPVRPEKPEDVPCPEGLKARGLAGTWVDLVKQSKKGNYSATSKLIDLAREYGDDPTSKPGAAVDHRYDGIPDETAALLRELDVGIADTVHRYEIGLPCADIEVLIAETAIAVREGGARSARVVELTKATVPIVQQLRKQKGLNDEQKQPTTQSRQTPNNRSQPAGLAHAKRPATGSTTSPADTG
jgi:hypothetical protein